MIIFTGRPPLKDLKGDRLYVMALERRVTKVLAKFFEKESCTDSGDLSSKVALIFIKIQSVSASTVAVRAAPLT